VSSINMDISLNLTATGVVNLAKENGHEKENK
jgi:hypothetical protein